MENATVYLLYEIDKYHNKLLLVRVTCLYPKIVLNSQKKSFNFATVGFCPLGSN